MRASLKLFSYISYQEYVFLFSYKKQDYDISFQIKDLIYEGIGWKVWLQVWNLDALASVLVVDLFGTE